VKFGVWCALGARMIVRPVFSNKKINFERYVQVILGKFFPALTEEEILYGWFQQDSATAHTEHLSMQALSDVFRIRIISSGIWPAHSPDLNPCDFFFWGCLKNKVYNSHLVDGRTKKYINREIANIPAEQVQRVNQNLFRWCKECQHIQGQHFQHLL
jgi:hypothetical protein